jgi:type VI secretion system protein ImpA
VAIDTAQFLQPIAGELPCGRNLDYTPELLALEAAAQEPDEPSLKDIAAVDNRNWRDVVAKAQNLLRESKDVRVVVYLARGLLHVEGVGSFCAVVSLLKALVEQYWDGLYPPLEEDGTDAVMRMNAISELWNPKALAAVRAAPLVSVRGLGDFGLNDVLVAKGVQKPKAGVTPPSPAHVLKAMEGVTAELAQQVHAAHEDIKLLESVVRKKAGEGHPFDAAPLKEILFRVAQTIKEHSKVAGPQATALPEGAVAGGEVQGVSAGGPVQMQILGSVQTRDDVVNMLEKIISYYEQHEPSSPVPLLMQRAKRLATMNFMEIMRDLADKGLPQIEAVAGKETPAK